MLCDSCKKNEATVHTVTIINGMKQEHYLCAECANAAQFKVPSLFDVLGGFQPTYTEQADCGCGQSFATFKKTGLLGCPSCYSNYHDRLMPVIKQMQGGRTHHVGRMPENMHSIPLEQTTPASAVEEKPLSELDRLRQELQAAIKSEKYERAAELRDRIHVLESEDKKE